MGPCFVSDLLFVQNLIHLVPAGITLTLKEAINPNYDDGVVSLSPFHLHLDSPLHAWFVVFTACTFLTRACGGRKTGAIFSHPICSDSIASFELQICEVSKLSAWKWVWLNPFDHLYLSTLDVIVTCQKVYLGLVLRRIPAQLGAPLNNETDPISI